MGINTRNNGRTQKPAIPFCELQSNVLSFFSWRWGVVLRQYFRFILYIFYFLVWGYLNCPGEKRGGGGALTPPPPWCSIKWTINFKLNWIISISPMLKNVHIMLNAIYAAEKNVWKKNHWMVFRKMTYCIINKHFCW